ncbi:MAG: BamA/TamA family outer membrane protein [Kofleriaceae bacterium]|nr:BamA/TamA family outer membrane protein [Kofleriaceae bacterium]
MEFGTCISGRWLNMASWSVLCVATAMAGVSTSYADGPASDKAATPSFEIAASETAASEIAASEDKNQPDDESRWAVFPVISSSPETSLMFGGVVLRHFRIPGPLERTESGSWPRRSSVAAFAAYSLNNQFIAALAPTLYLQGEQWSVGGGLSAVFFPGIFYEVGRDSRESSAENYTQRLFAGSLDVTRQVFSSFRVGMQFSAAHARITKSEAGGVLDSDGVVGSDGGLIVGAGPVVAWDSRDQDMSTQRGSLYKVAVNVYPRAFGGAYGYGLLSFNARRFFLTPQNHVLALSLAGQLGWGKMPFQVMAKLGGGNQLRGYFDARYIDIHGVVAQAEYRLPLFWRIGGAAFAGVGEVAGELSAFEPQELKFAGGVGLRYALNVEDRVNLRLDLAATGDGDINFYIAIGEAF